MELTLIVAALPSLIWLFFFLREDIHPEPKWMLARVFFLGAVGMVVAGVIQVVLQRWLISFEIGTYSALTLFLFAAIEEVLKFFAAYFAVIKSKLFDERVDAMIYMITAAMGFAMAENIAVLWGAALTATSVAIMTMRFIGAVLLHALASGVVGYYLARALRFKEQVGAENTGHYMLIVRGLFIATLLHGIFNYLIITTGNAVAFPLLFLIIVALLVFRNFETLKRGPTAS